MIGRAAQRKGMGQLNQTELLVHFFKLPKRDPNQSAAPECSLKEPPSFCNKLIFGPQIDKFQKILLQFDFKFGLPGQFGGFQTLSYDFETRFGIEIISKYALETIFQALGSRENTFLSKTDLFKTNYSNPLRQP